MTQPDLVFPSNKDGSPWEPNDIVRNLWESMAVSGFHEYYTAADWQAALMSMMTIDRYVTELRAGTWTDRRSSEVRSIMADLMVMESARRRLKIEVQRDKDTAPPLALVAPIDRARTAGL